MEGLACARQRREEKKFMGLGEYACCAARQLSPSSYCASRPEIFVGTANQHQDFKKIYCKLSCPPHFTHFTPFYCTFLYITLDFTGRIPPSLHVEYRYDLWQCTGHILRMSEPCCRVAALACSPSRPPQKLGGLLRWDDYISESGAQHVNFPA